MWFLPHVATAAVGDFEISRLDKTELISKQVAKNHIIDGPPCTHIYLCNTYSQVSPFSKEQNKEWKMEPTKNYLRRL